MPNLPPLGMRDREPTIDDPAELRAHRQQRLVLAYQLFGALHWGEQGDGHITARDPEQTDAFWLLRYGAPFGQASVDDLVLVDGSGAVIGGHPDGEINPAAHFIHWPILAARPDVISAAHTHTPYGTPWSANAQPFQPIAQEATAFFERHSVYRGEDVDVISLDGGVRIAEALGDGIGVILRNHGLLTVGASIDEAVGWFLMMERVAEVHVKATDPQPISDEAARESGRYVGHPYHGWQVFNWAIRARLDGG